MLYKSHCISVAFLFVVFMFLELLHHSLVEFAEARLRVAKGAAEQARSAATDTESVAETKWDTFGLESSYLAHGQSVRVAECEAELNYFRKLRFSEADEVSVGSVFRLEREDGWKKIIVLTEICGGGEFCCGDSEVLLVTPQTPLGKSLVGKEEGEELLMKNRGLDLKAEIVKIFHHLD